MDFRVYRTLLRAFLTLSGCVYTTWVKIDRSMDFRVYQTLLRAFLTLSGCIYTTQGLPDLVRMQ